jgi:hypothetical protein
MMSWHEHQERPASAAAAAAPPQRVTRRSVLRTAAGAGAASLVAGSVLGAIPATATATATAAAAGTAGAGAADAAGPLVVHVRDLRTGEMDIFAGTTMTRLRDRALAARLAGAR